MRQSYFMTVVFGTFLLSVFEPLLVSAEDPLAAHPKVAPAIQQINAVINMGPFEPTWESLKKYKIPQWYKDAKFGIFIHWGVYSVPAFGSE